MTDEFRNDMVRAIMRAWYGVPDYGGWSERQPRGICLRLLKS